MIIKVDTSAATSRPDISSSRVPLEVNQKHFSWRKAILHYSSYGSYFAGWSLAFPPQIADFGMSRDLDDDNYYISHGGKIPIKWTSPEVCDWRESTVKMISCMLCAWIKVTLHATVTFNFVCICHTKLESLHLKYCISELQIYSASNISEIGSVNFGFVWERKNSMYNYQRVSYSYSMVPSEKCFAKLLFTSRTLVWIVIILNVLWTMLQLCCVSCRPFTTASTPLPVTSGALGYWCMRYGV